MSSVAQPEYVKAQRKLAKEARERADKQYTRYYGKDEGRQRVEFIVALMRKNMTDNL